MKRHSIDAKLGQEHFCPPVERFRRGNFPPGGGNPRYHHHQQLSHLGEANLHQHLQQNHLLSNPSSSLVFNLCTGTLDWCLWVTSSVHYGRMLLTRHYDQRAFDENVCDALITNGDVKNRQKRCKTFAMKDTSNTAHILIACAMRVIRFSSLNYLR